MTSDDQWVRERARDIGDEIGIRGVDDAIAAALQEAISEERALAAELKLERDKWRSRYNRCDSSLVGITERLEAAEAKLARLRDPDEAMVEAVTTSIAEQNGSRVSDAWRADARAAIRALATTLDQEG